jgi:hypothetical protein
MGVARTLLFFVFLFACIATFGQDTIKPENVPTLNRVAEEYDDLKWKFGIGFSLGAGLLVVWNVLGFRNILKTKVDEWLDKNLERHTGHKIETIKAALQEHARNAELKKKRVFVVSAANGQQVNVKKVFDGCGFPYDERSWVNIEDVPNLILGNVDILLLNDQIKAPLSEHQIESVIKKFGKDVGYFYLGDKRIKSDEYREKYDIDIDFAASTTRLEIGLLSLLKIR